MHFLMVTTICAAVMHSVYRMEGTLGSCYRILDDALQLNMLLQPKLVIYCVKSIATSSCPALVLVILDLHMCLYCFLRTSRALDKLCQYSHALRCSIQSLSYVMLAASFQLSK